MTNRTRLGRLAALPLAAALALAGATAALAADATGKWAGEVKLPNGNSVPFVANLKQDGSTVTGTLEGINGAPNVTIENGKVENDVITFNGTRQIQGKPVKFNYTAHWAGDALDFDIAQADGGAAPLKSHTTRQQ
jgi:hypothetical protein